MASVAKLPLFKTTVVCLDFTVFVLGFFFNGRGNEEEEEVEEEGKKVLEVLDELDELDFVGRDAFLFFLFALGCGAGSCGALKDLEHELLEEVFELATLCIGRVIPDALALLPALALLFLTLVLEEVVVEEEEVEEPICCEEDDFEAEKVPIILSKVSSSIT